MYHFIKNIKKEHKIFLSVFLFFFMILIYFHIKYSVGLFFDQPAMFFGSIQDLDGNLNGYGIFNDDRIRYFSNCLVSIPYNISLFIYKNTVSNLYIQSMVSLYTSSYYWIHLFALLVNFLISLRTKRYDIGVIAFAFYCIFCMQNMLWAVREVHISILFYFALLSYFLSRQKLNKFDLIPITLLLVYMFESFEITIIYGFLIHIFAILYTVIRRKSDNLGMKNYIGIICLFISLYIIYVMSIELNQEIIPGFKEYFVAFYWYLRSIIYNYTVLSLFTIPPVLLCCFYKKPFGKGSLLCVLLYYFTAAEWIIGRTKLIHDAAVEIHSYAAAMILIFPVILIILIIDFFNIKTENKAFVPNLFIIACIVGILQLAWQIHGCFMFKQYIEYLKNVITISTEKLIQIPKEDYNNNKFLKLYMGYGIIHQSVLLNPNNPIDKIIVPSPCRKEEPTYWHDEKNTRIIQFGTILHNAPFWDKHEKYIDVTEITKYIVEQEKQNNLTEFEQ